MDATRMQLVARRFDDLSPDEARALFPLTLSRARGDVRDGEVADPGSTFRVLLQDLLRGFTGPLDRWVVLARPDGAGAPVAWCLVERLHEDPVTGARTWTQEGSVGFYVAPEWRRRGLASDLLRRSLTLARAQGWRCVVAFPWNRGSSAFFRSHGFIESVPYVTPVTGGVARLDLWPDP